MQTGKRLLLCAAVGVASFGVMQEGVERQTACFEETGVEIKDSPVGSEPHVMDDLYVERQIDESGCVNILNTLGSLGVGASLVGAGVTIGLAIVERRSAAGPTPPASVHG